MGELLTAHNYAICSTAQQMPTRRHDYCSRKSCPAMDSMFTVNMNYSPFCGSIFMGFKLLEPPQFIPLVFQFYFKVIVKFRDHFATG